MGSAYDEVHTPDRALVADARSGSVRAFELLVERYYAPMLRYLTRQTGDPELAADLTQETFLEAFRDLDRASDDRSFAAWLYSIARHNMLTATRRRGLRKLLSLDRLPSEVSAVIPALRGADVADALHERDLIQRMLDGMSPKLREALLLHSLWGFRGEEIARILGISPAAARQRVCRAKEEFDREYHRGGKSEPDDTAVL